MKHFLRTIAVLSMLAALFVRPLIASACSCMQQSQQEAFAAATDVFEGRVRSIQQEAAANGHEATMAVELDVVQTWKGANHERITIHTGLNSASCGFPFEEHNSYLVYTHASEGRTLTGLCNRTRPMSEASEDLRALGAGVTPVDIDPNARPRSRAGSPSRPRAN